MPNNSSVTVGSAPKGITTTTKELRERENNTHTQKKTNLFDGWVAGLYLWKSAGEKKKHTLIELRSTQSIIDGWGIGGTQLHMHRTQHNSAEWNKRLFLPWSDFSRYLIFFPVIIPCVVLYHFRRFDKKKKSFWLVLLYIVYLLIYFWYTLIIHILFYFFSLGWKKNVVLVLSQCTDIQTNIDTRWVLCLEQWRRLHSREIRFYFVFICLLFFLWSVYFTERNIKI